MLRSSFPLFLIIFLGACATSTSAYRATPQSVQTPEQRPNPRLFYTASFEADALVVELKIAAGFDVTRTPLQLPAAPIADLAFEGDGGFVTEPNDEGEIWVEHDGAFSISYRVLLDREPDLTRRKLTSTLWEWSEDGLMATGGFLWVVPLYPVELDVHFDWQDIPTEFATRVHSWPGESTQAGTMRAYELVQSVHIIGRFRAQQSGRSVFFAPDVHDVSADAVLDVANEVLTAAGGFFGEPAPERFIVIVLPDTAERSGSNVSGNALTNAAIVWQRKWPHLRQFLAHEIVHHWNPWHELDEVDWFAEGMTDFIAALLLFRAEMITVAEFAEEANAWHRTYYGRVLDPETTGIGGDPRYEVGFMLGARWFRHAKFRETIAHAFRDRDDDQTLLRRLQDAFGVEPVAIAAHLDGTSPIEPSSDAFGDCVTLRSLPQGAPDLGFDEDRTSKRRRFVGVTRGGPAFKAGIREGMKFKRLRFSSGGVFASDDVEITLLNGEELRYFPSRRPYPVPIYVSDEAAQQSKRQCVDSLESKVAP